MPMTTKRVHLDRVEYLDSNGYLHREDGPAVEYFNGNKYWYHRGRYHRIGGPAVECIGGGGMWYKHGDLHRIDGPAVEGGQTYWYLGGVEYEEYLYWQEVLTVYLSSTTWLAAYASYKVSSYDN